MNDVAGNCRLRTAHDRCVEGKNPVYRLLSLIVLQLLSVSACHRQAPVDFSGPTAGWPVSTGSSGGGQYSVLTQINKQNLKQLQVAWTYQSPDFENLKDVSGASFGGHASSGTESTPIITAGKLVLCTPMHRVVALDPTSGKHLWDYDPKMDRRVGSHYCRGVAAWSESSVVSGKACQQRIFSTTGDGRLMALDLADGKPCEQFGTLGTVDMKANLGPLKITEYYQTAPPLVFKDLVIAGSAVRDGFRNDTAGGVVRAWDVRTGKLVWAWDPVGPSMTPVTAEDAAAGKIFTRGTPNVWSFMSADLDHGLIYLPTGNAPADHFKGPNRDIDHYGSSVVALDAGSGHVVWSFQTVHHDLWDYDVPAQPVLYEHPGNIPALAVATKVGYVFLLNRLTGEPLFPVEERPVPASDVPGEWTSPTQPVPTAPRPVFAERLTEAGIMNYPVYSKGCKKAFASLRNEGMFTPPSLKGSLQRPGISGGFNWGSGSVNPNTNTYVATFTDMPFIVKLHARASPGDPEHDDGPFNWVDSPQYGTPFDFHRAPFLSEKVVPCVKPPWGLIVAFDLNSGNELWRKPLGSLRGQVPVVGGLLNVGTPLSGGNLQTASGIVFVAASADSTLRALDAGSGEELWSTRLPFSAHASPMTYRLTQNGKQYLVLSTGGTYPIDTEIGNTLVAFALAE